jgi:peroxiredoxin
MNELIYFYAALALEAAAFGLLLGSCVYLLWGLLSGRGHARSRRFRLSASYLVLFVAMFATGAWLIYFVQIPAMAHHGHPEFQAPYAMLGHFFSVLGPALLFASVGILISKLFGRGGGWKRVALTSLTCFTVFLATGAAMNHLTYAIQIPALSRFAMIGSREYLTKIGDPAPNVTFNLVDGRQVRLSDYRGKVVLLNFFATWCRPCQVELPHLQQIWSDLRHDDFVVLVVGREETQDSVADFQAEKNFTFPMAYDSDRSAYGLFADDGIPRTYLIGKDGTILYQSIGFGEHEVYQRELVTLRSLIEQELQEAS